MHEIPHDRIQPGVRVNAKDDRWIFTNFQLIDGRLRQNLAKDTYLFHHPFAHFFGRDALHCFSDEFQITFIRDTELDFVPNVGKERPSVVVDRRAQDFRIWKLNDAAAGMIRREKIAAKFPQSSIEVTNVDHVALGIADLDAIADSIRRARQNVNPSEKTCHRRLHREAEN